VIQKRTEAQKVKRKVKGHYRDRQKKREMRLTREKALQRADSSAWRPCEGWVRSDKGGGRKKGKLNQNEHWLRGSSTKNKAELIANLVFVLPKAEIPGFVAGEKKVRKNAEDLL